MLLLNKNGLRAFYRSKRKAVSDKAQRDKAIRSRLLTLEAFRTAETILCYASATEEVDTDEIIRYALSVGKIVAVPYCEDKNGKMSFYRIKGLDELRVGYYHIRQPDVSSAEKLTDFSNALLIVPGVSFDKSGARLGYGGGYYDRFMAQHPLQSVGLCYDDCISGSVPTEAHDKTVDILITESETIQTNGGKNG